MRKMTRIYGIKQCSTMQKAFAWLDAAAIPFEFHDYKKLGADEATLRQWVARVGWEALVNTRGTTWRKLDEASRKDLDTERAIALMREHTSLIRRPVLVQDELLLIGFDEQRYNASLKGQS